MLLYIVLGTCDIYFRVLRLIKKLKTTAFKKKKINVTINNAVQMFGVSKLLLLFFFKKLIVLFRRDA